MKPYVNIYGTDCYEILFVYVNDILGLVHKLEDAIRYITNLYIDKEGIFKDPMVYLVANVEKVYTPAGREVWFTYPII